MSDPISANIDQGSATEQFFQGLTGQAFQMRQDEEEKRRLFGWGNPLRASEYELINQSVSVAPDKSEAVHKWQMALSYSSFYKTNLMDAYNNLEAYHKDFTGLELPTRVVAGWESMGHAWEAAMADGAVANLGNELMDLDLGKGTRTREQVLADLRDAEKHRDEHTKLMLNTPDEAAKWIATYGVRNAPDVIKGSLYSIAGVVLAVGGGILATGGTALAATGIGAAPGAAALSGGIATTGLGAAIAAAGVGTLAALGQKAGAIVSSAETGRKVAGLEYVRLTNAGVPAATALNIAKASGGIQGFIEGGIEAIIGSAPSQLAGGVAQMLTKQGAKGAASFVAGGAAEFISSKVGRGIAMKMLNRGVGRAVAGAMLDSGWAPELFIPGVIKAGIGYVTSAVGEGVEEVAQQVVEDLATDYAIAVAPYSTLPRGTVESRSRNYVESFKGGFMASLILGVPGSIANTAAFIGSSANDIGVIKAQAVLTDSKQAFLADMSDKKPEGVMPEAWNETLSDAWEIAQKERATYESKAGATVDPGDVDIEAEIEGAPEGGTVTRLPAGGLYVRAGEQSMTSDGKVRTEMLFGSPVAGENGKGERYGTAYITELDDKTIRVDSVRTRPFAKGERIEFLQEALAKYPDHEVVFADGLSGLEKQYRAANPRGPETAQAFTKEEAPRATLNRAALARTLIKNVPGIKTSREANMGAIVYEKIAKYLGKTNDEMAKMVFGNEIIKPLPDEIAETIGDSGETPKGATAWKNMKAVIYTTKKADFSTWVHELLHATRPYFKKDDLAVIEAALGVEGGKWSLPITRNDNGTYSVEGKTYNTKLSAQNAANRHEEQLARDFERYLLKGEVPNEGLRRVFEKIAQLMRDIYNGLTSMNAEIDPRIKAVFDKIMGDDEGRARMQPRQTDGSEDLDATQRAMREKMVADYWAAHEAKPVTAMTEQERADRLLLNPLTGIGSKQAYLEDSAAHIAATGSDYKVKIAIDADSLKWWNDNLGHQAGNELLQAVAHGMIRAAESVPGISFYHFSGDEYAAQTDSQEAAELFYDRMQDILAHTILEGGLADAPGMARLEGITFGIGFNADADMNKADANSVLDKTISLAQGQRAGRGEMPPRAVYIDESGKEWPHDEAATMFKELAAKREEEAKAAVDTGLSNATDPLHPLNVRRRKEDRRKAMAMQAQELAVAKEPDPTPVGAVEDYSEEQRASLAVAVRMEGEGKPAAEIYQATGWKRGEADTRWQADPLFGQLFQADDTVTLFQTELAHDMDELVRFAESAGDWKNWHDQHEASIQEAFGEDSDLFKKLLAATSQANTVPGNVTLAVKAYRQLLAGEPFTGYLPAVIGNLNSIRENETVRGRKISEYAKAVSGDESGIAVARHITRLLFGKESGAPTKAETEQAKAIINEIAARLGWTPRGVHAALWAYNQIKDGLTPRTYAEYINKKRADIERARAERIMFQTDEEAEVDARLRGTDAWMKAPNGKPTNLTERQWIQVRTPAFKAWFGDWENDPANASKVVDESGEPLVMYHGTHGGDFDIFKPSKHGALGPGIYFTDVLKKATLYAKGSSFEMGPSDRVIPAFIKSITPMKIENLQVAPEKVFNFFGNPKDYELPGLVEKAGFDAIWATGQAPGPWAPLEPEIVVFSPNQIKSATDNSGAFSPANDSILYQTDDGAPIEVGKNFVALHNISQENIRAAQEIGGLPMPSIAVTKQSIPFTEFAEITLVAKKDVALDAMKSGELYTRDIYSPTVPEATWKINTKAIDNIDERFSKIAEQYGEKYFYSPSGSLYKSDYATPRKYASKLVHMDAVKIAYYEETTGSKVAPIYREKRRRYPISVIEAIKKILQDDESRKIWDQFDNDHTDIAARKKEKKYKPMLKEIRAAYDIAYSDFTKKERDEFFEIDLFERDTYKLEREAIEYQPGEQELDSIATMEQIENYTKREDMLPWAYSIVRSAYSNPRIPLNGKLVEYNAENIVRKMKGKGIVGVQETPTFGPAIAKSFAARMIPSMEKLGKEGARLVTREEERAYYDEKIKPLTDELINVMPEYGSGDTHENLNAFFKAVGDALKRGIRDKGKSIKAALSANGFRKVPGEVVDKVVALYDAMDEAPQAYLEAKPQRVVYFTDFIGAVVPKDVAQDTIDTLEGYGITVKKTGADAWDGPARAAAVQELAAEIDNILFQTMDEEARDIAEKWDPETISVSIDTETDIATLSISEDDDYFLKENLVQALDDITEMADRHGIKIVVDGFKPSKNARINKALEAEGFNLVNGSVIRFPKRAPQQPVNIEPNIDDQIELAEREGYAPNGNRTEIGSPERWAIVRTPAFKRWFGDWQRDPMHASKIVDENGEPLVMYHGSTSVFDAFDRQRANVEGNMGAGFYFTSAVSDADRNYVGGGPDMDAKIARRAEELESEGDLDSEEAEAQARAELDGGENMLLNVFLDIKNPVILKEKGGTHWEYRYDDDEETDEYGEPVGELADYIDRLREVASDYYDGPKYIEDVIQEVMDNYPDGGTANQVIGATTNNEKLHWIDDEYGNPIGSEIVRQALEAMGYDGIVDKTVSKKFLGMVIPADAFHAIVFRPNQIKHADDNTGAFSPEDARFMFQMSEAEIDKEAATFDTWEEWRAYIETMDVDVKPPEGQDRETWYRKRWELAMERMRQSSTDRSVNDEFVAYISNDENLRDFLVEMGNVLTFNPKTAGAPMDEQEAMEYEQRVKAGADVGRYATPTIRANALRAYAGKDVTPRAIASIRTTMAKIPAEYRALYSAITGSDRFTSAEDRGLLDELPEIAAPMREKLENASAETRYRFVREIKDEELRKRWLAGDELMEGEAEAMVKRLHQRKIELEKEAEGLKADIAEGEKKLTDTEREYYKLGQDWLALVREDNKLNAKIEKLTSEGKAVRAELATERMNSKKRVTAARHAYETMAKMMGRTVDRMEKDADLAAEQYANLAKDAAKTSNLDTVLSKRRKYDRVDEDTLAAVDAIRAARAMQEHKQTLVKNIMKPVAASTDWQYRVMIEAIQGSINPKNKTALPGWFIEITPDLEGEGVVSGVSPQLKKAAEEALAMGGLDPELRDYYERLLGKKSFNELSVAELEDIAMKVADLRKWGSLVHKGKMAARKMATDRRREAIIAAIASQGLPTTPPEGTGTVEAKRRDKGIASSIGAAYRATLNMARIAEMLDGRKGGTNWRLLVQNMRDAFQMKTKKKDERMVRVKEAMDLAGIKASDLETTFTVDMGNGVFSTYTIDDVLHAKAADMNEKSREAFEYGTLIMASEKATMSDIDILEVGAQRMSKLLAIAYSLDSKYSGVFNAIMGDYEANFERLNDAAIAAFNQGMRKEQAYSPIYRTESTGEDLAATMMEDLLAGTSIKTKATPKKGMTKERITISPRNQGPIKMGLFSTWLQAVEMQEHFIAFTPAIKDARAVYEGFGSSTVKEAILAGYGSDVLKQITAYLNEVANPSAFNNHETLAKIVRAIRGQIGPAYLAWKLSSVIKQFITSPIPFFAYVSPLEYAGAAAELAGNRELADEINRKSAAIKERRMNEIAAMIHEATAAPGQSKLARFNKKQQEIGLMGLEIADRSCVMPGWLAVYRKALSNGKAELEAIREADTVLVECQPSARAMDMAAAFKQKGLAGELIKTFTQFMNPLSVIWQQITFDMPRAVKNREFGKAFGIMAGYVVSGLALSMLNGFDWDDEDDEEKKRAKLAAAAISQFTDSVPFVGDVVTSLWYSLLTGDSKPVFQDSPVQGISDVADGARVLATRIIGETDPKKLEAAWTRAITEMANGFGIQAGAPVSGVKELIDAFTGNPLRVIGYKRRK